MQSVCWQKSVSGSSTNWHTLISFTHGILCAWRAYPPVVCFNLSFYGSLSHLIQVGVGSLPMFHSRWLYAYQTLSHHMLTCFFNHFHLPMMYQLWTPAELAQDSDPTMYRNFKNLSSFHEFSFFPFLNFILLVYILDLTYSSFLNGLKVQSLTFHLLLQLTTVYILFLITIICSIIWIFINQPKFVTTYTTMCRKKRILWQKIGISVNCGLEVRGFDKEGTLSGDTELPMGTDGRGTNFRNPNQIRCGGTCL